MPICHICEGTGQKEVDIQITKPCPDCQGSIILPSGETCQRCRATGELATQRHKTIVELCDTCWGSGEISHTAVNIWLSLRLVPLTVGLLGGGLAASSGVWTMVETPVLITLPLSVGLLIWITTLFYYTQKLHQFGPVSAWQWFILRAGGTSLVILGIGGATVWNITTYVVDPRIIVSSALGVLALWAISMFYFILFDTPKEFSV